MSSWKKERNIPGWETGGSFSEWMKQINLFSSLLFSIGARYIANKFILAGIRDSYLDMVMLVMEVDP